MTNIFCGNLFETQKVIQLYKSYYIIKKRPKMTILEKH